MTLKNQLFFTNSTFIIFANLFNMLVWPWQIPEDAFLSTTFVYFKEKPTVHLLILSILHRLSLCAWMIHPRQGNRGTNSHSISRSAQWPASIWQYDTVIDHAHFWRPASWQWGWRQGSRMTTVLALKTCVYMQTRLLLYVGKTDTHLNSFLYAQQFNLLPLNNARWVSRPIAIQHQSVLLIVEVSKCNCFDLIMTFIWSWTSYITVMITVAIKANIWCINTAWVYYICWLEGELQSQRWTAG